MVIFYYEKILTLRQLLQRLQVVHQNALSLSSTVIVGADMSTQLSCISQPPLQLGDLSCQHWNVPGSNVFAAGYQP